MTIDDFDVNEISDKLAVREETDDSYTLQALHNDGVAHDDGHDDGGCPHDDNISGAFHDDHTCGHNDGHFDIANHDDAHDDCPFVGGQLCP